MYVRMRSLSLSFVSRKGQVRVLKAINYTANYVCNTLSHVCILTQAADTQPASYEQSHAPPYSIEKSITRKTEKGE